MEPRRMWYEMSANELLENWVTLNKWRMIGQTSVCDKVSALVSGIRLTGGDATWRLMEVFGENLPQKVQEVLEKIGEV